MLLFLFLGIQIAFTQKFPEKGVPLLKNFTPLQYHNKGKIWDIRSAENGIIYMAADGGLLEYDGKTWNFFKGSKGFTRSLTIVNDSLIYTGSDLDFGVWKKNKYQDFEYKSLYPFTKDISDINEEFWDVHHFKDNIIFVSAQNIYLFKNNQLTKISAPYKFSGSFAVNDTLYFADEKNGLYVFNGLSLTNIFKNPSDSAFKISGISHHNKGIVVVTKSSGLYFFSSGILLPLDNILSRELKTSNVFCFEPIGEKYFAYGTILNGLYITDLEGKIIHHINKQKGLANNTILSLHYSPSGQLWIGMDYGSSSLNLNSAFTYFYDYRGDFGTASSAVLKDQIFYLGTNQGLYVTGWDDLNNDKELNSFQLIPGTNGQVWDLENIDNKIFMGHDRGLFTLEDNKVKSLNTEEGVWTIVPYNDFLLTGNYNGISIYKKTGENWIFHKKMELILGSCNQIVVEKDNILWINIPNFGIIRASIDSNLLPTERLIFENDIFEGDYLHLVINEKGITAITDNSQYRYDSIEKNFKILSDVAIFPGIDGLLPSVFQVSKLHDDYGFYPVYNGFALKYFRNTEQIENKNYSLNLRKIEAFNNDDKTLLYPGATVPYRMNNLNIELSIPNQENVLYQHKLKNSDNWSAWSSENNYELLNLREGTYKLYVRAKINDTITEPEIITFKVNPPWYRSWIAYAFYVLFVASIFYLIVLWQKLSLKKQKKKLLKKEQNSLRQQATKHKQEMLRLEQDQLKNEYEILKQQLKSKTIELANKAKDNEDKNRLLITLKEKLEDTEKYPAKSSIRWTEMQRLLDAYLNTEDKTFEIQMDELHQEFFKKLKEKYSGLSTNDLRLCAYLKIGMNSKEIAEILNVLPSSAYISRSRLRKKLNLDTEEDLHNFLNNI